MYCPKSPLFVSFSVITFFAFAASGWSQSSVKTEDPKFTEPARNYDLQNVRVELKLDVDEKSFEGQTTNTIVPLFNGVNRVRFDAVGLEISSVTLNGKKLRFAPFEESPRKGIEVELDRSYGETDKLPITIQYSCKNPEKGLYFVQPDAAHPDKAFQIWSQGEDMDNRYWIPTYDYPNDRTATEFFFTVREPLTAVSNGTLIDVKPAGESNGKKWQTFHWKMEQPYVTYLMAIGAADWEKYTDTISLPGRATPLPVDYYVNRGVGEATARRSYEETPRMIKFFSEKIGVPYPWDKYAQVTVSDFVVGGMENVSVTLQTDRTLHDERSHLDQSSRGLVAHELAHQWWGDYLTCRRWADLWLNEGFATYFQCLYEREAEGEDSFRVSMRGNQQSARNSDPKDNPRPIVETFVDPKSQGKSNAIYVKGSSVLYMIHKILGEELWWKAIHHYASKHALDTVDTHDFEIAIREATGRNLDWFFQQYVYLGGYPEFEVTHEWTPETQQSKITVKQTQKIEGIRPLFRIPVDIAITTEKGSKSYTVCCDTAEQNFYFPVESKPLMVRFDKDSWVYKTVKFEQPTEMIAYQLLNDPDVIGRIEAAETLGGKKDEAAKVIPTLAQALKNDKVFNVRSAAASALGKLGGVEAKTALLGGLKDVKSNVRRSCVEALSNYKDDAELATPLAEIFRKDPSYPTQSSALNALVKVDSKHAPDYIQEGLSIPSYRDQLAARSIDLLAEQKDPEAAKKVRPYLEASYSPEIQRAAIAALGRIGKEKPEAEKKEIVDAILAYGERESRNQMGGVVRALSSLGDKRAIPYLEKLANGNFRRGVSEAAKRAIEDLKAEKKDDKKPAAADTDALKKEIEKLRQQVESLEKRIPPPAQSAVGSQ